MLVPMSCLSLEIRDRLFFFFFSLQGFKLFWGGRRLLQEKDNGLLAIIALRIGMITYEEK